MSNSLNTAGWLEFPLTVGNHSLVSKLAPNSPFLSRVKVIGNDIFNQMNIQAVVDLVPDLSCSTEKMKEYLDELNAGATHAVIVLAE